MSGITATTPRTERVGAAVLTCGDAFALAPRIGPADFVMADWWFAPWSADYARQLGAVVALAAPIAGPRVVCLAQEARHASRWSEAVPAGYRLFVSCDAFVDARFDTAQPFLVWGRGPGGRRRRPHFHVQDQDERPQLEGLGHPSLRPVALMETLVRTFTDPGECIVDLFMGAGALAIACRRLNRRYVGFERDPDHFETALRRLRAEP